MLHLIGTGIQEPAQRLVLIGCILWYPVVDMKQLRTTVIQQSSGLYPVQDTQLNDALQVDRLRTALQITVRVRFNVKLFCYVFLRHPFVFPCLAQARTNSSIVDISHVYTSFSVFTHSPDCVIAVWALGVHTF